MKQNDVSQDLQQSVLQALQNNEPLEIKGGGSKSFYGRRVTATPLSVNAHQGVVNYQPKELVITVRCGTPLAEVESVLAEQGQMLAFEPPHFNGGATLGGAIAAGLSGPRRAYSGSARDFVLGTTIINGRGEILRFGGEVMKNVAGYDVSRLMTGAVGTLGIILDASLKVLPRPHQEITLVQECDYDQAIERMNELATRDIPLSASFYDGLNLYLRLSGTASAVRAGLKNVGGDKLESPQLWQQLRDIQHAFFQQDMPLWRLSVPSDTPYFDLQGRQGIEWGGALRWVFSNDDADSIRSTVSSIGGHATLFRSGDAQADIFHPLAAGIDTIHKNLKRAFDPQGIFNPEKMYRGL